MHDVAIVLGHVTVETTITKQDWRKEKEDRPEGLPKIMTRKEN